MEEDKENLQGYEKTFNRQIVFMQSTSKQIVILRFFMNQLGASVLLRSAGPLPPKLGYQADQPPPEYADNEKGEGLCLFPHQ